jgi:sigma-B regulation protein RsbU (phosphoserine phosphatase)
MIRNGSLISPYAKAASLEISKSVCAADGSRGGDRADVLHGTDGTLHLIILDVCGHGARAAEFADMILHTVRVLLWQGLTPDAVFTSLNELVVNLYDEHDKLFGSGAIASLDRDRSFVTFASAGHVDALCFKGDGRSHVHHSSTGPLYGVFDHAPYYNRVFPCLPGDTLVMVTDGLLDVKSIATDGSYLGTSGISRIVRDLISSAEGLFAARLISDVRRKAGGAFNDDVAAIIARQLG